jgi:hypothetical protein
VSRAFDTLKWCSFAHSTVYAALLAAALTGADTTVLGWVHGIGWILMSIACLIAVRAGVLALRVASYMFIRETRARERVG